jgi:hypothetical protein
LDYRLRNDALFRKHSILRGSDVEWVRTIAGTSARLEEPVKSAK